MPIDHLSFPVPHAKFEDEVQFLLKALAHMNFKEMMRPMPGLVGIGDAEPFYWLAGVTGEGKPILEEQLNYALFRPHVAISAKNRGEVDEFHRAALKAGGKDNGAPGIRAEYHPGYYGAFAISPAGINVEVVVHYPDTVAVDKRTATGEEVVQKLAK